MMTVVSRIGTYRGAAFAAALSVASGLASSPAAAADPVFTITNLGTLGGSYSYAYPYAGRGLSADGSVAVAYSYLVGDTGYHAFLWTSSGLTDLGTIGGSYSWPAAVSLDGSAVTGYSYTSGNSALHAFRWTAAGGMIDLGTLGGTHSYGYAISADGSAVAGRSMITGNSGYHAFRWTASDGMADLGTLGGSSSEALAISADGTIVSGQSRVSGDVYAHAFRWTVAGVMTDLGTLGGYSSWENDMSTDGSVVVGGSYTIGNSSQRAFRWTATGGMSNLGTLGGDGSEATGVSGDGSTVIGYANVVANSSYHAFRWTAADGMVDLGTLGGDWSYARGVSRDGSVIVGYAFNTANRQQAFRWTTATGMRSITDLLIASGVDMTGWDLYDATAVSADGTTILGNGVLNSNSRAWIARCVVGCGLITPEAVMQSAASVAAVGRTGNAALGGALGTFSEYAGQALDKRARGQGGFSVFANGLYDSDPTLAGTVGGTWAVTRDVVIGASLGGTQIKTDLDLDGSAKFDGVVGGVFAAYEPDAGLQLFGGLAGTSTSGRITRGYLNGNTPTTSVGDTKANGFAATARIGWAFDEVLPKVRATPFASLTWASTRFDGWTETGGPFPASFQGFTADETTSRLGVETRWTYEPDNWVWGSLAWGHRLDGAKSATIRGQLTGIMDFGVAGARTATDWAEIGLGTRRKIGDFGAATASVTATVPNRGVVTWMPRVGLSVSF